MHLALGKHGIVLDLALAKGRCVCGDDDNLALVEAEGLDCCLVAQGSLARLHDELDARVHGLDCLLGLLSLRGHFFSVYLILYKLLLKLRVLWVGSGLVVL